MWKAWKTDKEGGVSWVLPTIKEANSGQVVLVDLFFFFFFLVNKWSNPLLPNPAYAPDDEDRELQIPAKYDRGITGENVHVCGTYSAGNLKEYMHGYSNCFHFQIARVEIINWLYLMDLYMCINDHCYQALGDFFFSFF